jgi:hypothetical protein
VRSDQGGVEIETMTEIAEQADPQISSHDYHAEAHVLSGHLQRPIEQKIEQQSPVVLRDQKDGHLVRFSEEVSIEGLISFSKGKTRVSGSRSAKTNGWVTLSTSIMEGLNALEVLTADRVVSQVSTEHPVDDGHFPHVTFLGTQFSNLKVSGFPVTLKLNFGICGKRPEGNRSYLRDIPFLSGVREQADKIANTKGLPKDLKARYDQKLSYINNLIRACDENESPKDEPKVTCSLVESIGEIPIPGVVSYGNVLVIPDFGSVALGEIEVGEKNYEDSKKPAVYFKLTAINMSMGCVADGTALAGTAMANGRHKP